MSRLKAALILTFLFLFSSCFLAAPACGASAVGGFGLRAGYDPDPDQFIAGGQLILGRALGFMRFMPSFDIGFGDRLRSYTANFDFRVIRLRPPKSQSALYAAIGPTLVIWDYDRKGSNTDFGATISGGLEIPMGRSGHYIAEVRLGLGDAPDLRLIGGITFWGG